MDRTNRILYELEQMINEGVVRNCLKEKIQVLIKDVRDGYINLYRYRQPGIEASDDQDVVKLIAEANRRQEERQKGSEGS